MKNRFKKALVGAVSVCMAFGMFSFVACGGGEEPSGHVHNWSAEWEHDGTGHWHDCLNGCDEKNGYAQHSYEDGECVCGYQDPDYEPPVTHTHNWSAEWEHDGAGHWHECLNGCDEKNGYEQHSYVDGVCVCGYHDPNYNPVPVLPTDETPTIYLAGDSTVKTYSDGQFIGGWGQYLDLFLDSEIVVANAAQGGRSSRSFINEGRLYNIDDPAYSYTFSENNGNSIEDVIEEGDFLFIQFGHNDDDTKKESSYSTMPDRMTPLGTPDANGVYPTVVPTDDMKKATTYLPDEYITSNPSEAEKADHLEEFAKYGSQYYAYDSGATYKGYLKVYIDFARSVGATPVLVTPVARTGFNSDGTLKDGPGRHGDDFAYVKAVRQLAEEEDVLLVDLFDYTKEVLETAGPTYADYLMALVPNSLTGTWPTDYDNIYGNAELGFEKIEGTHYNKYGAFITAAAVAQTIIDCGNTVTANDGTEYFNFASHVLAQPEQYIDPSNRMPISTVEKVESILETVSVTNPNRVYKQPSEVIAAIEALAARGEISSITAENFEQWLAWCAEVRAEYNELNYDLRDQVTNISVLEKYEAAAEAARPRPTETIVFNPSVLATGAVTAEAPLTSGIFKFVGGSSSLVQDGSMAFEHRGQSYTVTKRVSLGGGAHFGSDRYIEFTTTGECIVTFIIGTTGTSVRTMQLRDVASGSNIFTLDTTADKTQCAIGSYTIGAAGTYQIGSASSGMYIYGIIIEYFA